MRALVERRAGAQKIRLKGIGLRIRGHRSTGQGARKRDPYEETNAAGTNRYALN
jgi:hypothetical protein